MMKTHIRKVGNSVVMTLTTEMLSLLDAKEGDNLYVVSGGDGSLRIMVQEPEIQSVLEAVEQVMGENRDALRALA